MPTPGRTAAFAVLSAQKEDETEGRIAKARQGKGQTRRSKRFRLPTFAN